MSTLEGNLEAPTRHPVDWKNPDFYDADSLRQPMPGVSEPVRPDRRDRRQRGARCREGRLRQGGRPVLSVRPLCYMTKCPYVLPHPWNLDFPHTMLRAKAIKHKAGQVGAGERLLASTDVHGQFAGIPVVVQIVNAVNKTRPMRKALDATLERVGYRLLDGTYGVKTATHPIAIKIGKPVFKAMAKGEPDFISSDCALAGHHIAQGMQQNQHAAAKLAHPLSLVRMAYGLE